MIFWIYIHPFSSWPWKLKLIRPWKSLEMKIMSLKYGVNLPCANNLLVVHLSKFVKLAQMAIVLIINNIEDERTFSTLIFMKFKVRNWLVEHLDITVCMFVQDFCTKNTFLFQATIVDWNGEHKVRIEVNAWSNFFLSVTCFEIWCDLYYNTNFVNCSKHFVLQWPRSLWLGFKSPTRSSKWVIIFKF
jgi:hypothetical protein